MRPSHQPRRTGTAAIVIKSSESTVYYPRGAEAATSGGSSPGGHRPYLFPRMPVFSGGGGGRTFGGDNLGFPVGRGVLPIYTESTGLPVLVTGAPMGPTSNIPAQIDRRDTVTDVYGWFEYHEMVNLGKSVRHVPSGTVHHGTDTQVAAVVTAPLEPTYGPVAGPIVNYPLAQPLPGDSEMDLGQLAVGLLNQWGTAAIQNAYAPSATPQAPTPAVITVPRDPITGAYVQTGHCKKRRRRRALATSAEIAQVTSLKATLSPQEMKIWLAKRLRN